MSGKVKTFAAIFIVAVMAFISSMSQPAMTQSTTVAPSAIVVDNCGALTQDFVTARAAPLTVNKEGVLCSTISGGGSGVAVTIADGADVAEGAIADAAASIGGAGTVSAKLRLVTTQLNAILTSTTLKGYEFQLAPTITVDAGAYAAGDSMGGLITLTGAARTAGGSGILNGIRLKSTGGSTNTIWIYAWSKTPTATCTNNAAYVPNAADNAYALVGFPTSVVMGNAPGAWDTSTYAQLTALISNFKNQDTVPSTELKFCLVTAGAVTPASTTDLSMNAVGMQD